LRQRRALLYKQTRKRTAASKAERIREKAHNDITAPMLEAGLKLCEFMSTLKFWCEDDTLHKRNPDYQHTAKCCTTHIVGLPRHPATDEEMIPTKYQMDLVHKVLTGRLKFGDAIAQMRKALKFHIKKGRQMGFTEIVLRIIQHLCFTRYKGRKVGIIAATNGSLARKDLRRFARLFKAIPSVIKSWISSRQRSPTDIGSSGKNVMELVNGTEIEAFSASEEALTGDTKYKCIFMDEAAKWKLVDDSPVFNSILPIVRTNGSDFFLVSTPKGPTKKFYKIDMEHNEDEFVFLVYDITHTIGNLYTQEQVDEMLASSAEDPDQEYMTQYKAGQDSIFGAVSKEDMQGKSEWTVDDDGDEEEEWDDGYEENRDDDNIIHAV